MQHSVSHAAWFVFFAPKKMNRRKTMRRLTYQLKLNLRRIFKMQYKVCSNRCLQIKFKKKLDKCLINVYLISRLKNAVSIFSKDWNCVRANLSMVAQTRGGMVSGAERGGAKR